MVRTLGVPEAVIVSYIALQVLITLTVILAGSYTVYHIWQEKCLSISKCRLAIIWGKALWKMRSIYSSLAVHIFDFITDLLVIHEWYHAESKNVENGDIEHVDTRLMALCSIIILLGHVAIERHKRYFKTI